MSLTKKVFISLCTRCTSSKLCQISFLLFPVHSVVFPAFQLGMFPLFPSLTSRGKLPESFRRFTTNFPPPWRPWLHVSGRASTTQPACARMKGRHRHVRSPWEKLRLFHHPNTALTRGSKQTRAISLFFYFSHLENKSILLPGQSVRSTRPARTAKQTLSNPTGS